MKDSAAQLLARGYVCFLTDSLMRHDVLIYILSRPIPLEVLCGVHQSQGEICAVPEDKT